ncbi:MAG: hypothetical protein JWR72_3633 [Flavisolibacter sp.]|jgi:hypothetical protein|nr:hypothetical protein [Flavisolibacter sp.]
MDVTAALQNLTTNLSVDEKATVKNELSAYLNYLLINDFSALVQILYRVDVSEQKLKTVLLENKEADAGDLLSELLIERQAGKTTLRQSFPPSEDLSGEESW